MQGHNFLPFLRNILLVKEVAVFDANQFDFPAFGICAKNCVPAGSDVHFLPQRLCKLSKVMRVILVVVPFKSLYQMYMLGHMLEPQKIACPI
jgi:hypothetical protein